MGDDSDILQMTVCLRDGKDSEAVEQLKATYPDEAKNAELDNVDITAKFKVRFTSWHYSIETPVGSSSGAQHPKPSAVVESSSSSDPPFSGDDVESS
jgi:hypothetical protein